MSDEHFLETVKSEQQEIIDLLKNLVERESPSTDKALVDDLGSFLVSHMKEAGFSPQVVPREDVGDIIWIEWDGGAKGSILVLCHIDTVWEQGSLARLPFRIEGNWLHGPGIFDMKAGVAATLKIQDYIAQGLIRPERNVRFLYTTDEEIGSRQSQELIEEFSRLSDLVLVTEPPLPGGVLKTFRKGAGTARIKIYGRAAHAGVEPEKGINAVEELARQVLNIQALSSAEKETTVSVTIARGGTRDNVIPDSADATVDFRFRTVEEGQRVEAALRHLEPHLSGARIEASGGINRPPMIKGPKSEALFVKAREIGGDLGLDLKEGETGGGSDGSFSAALGVPTLDGLGVDGDGAHAVHEHIELDALPVRVALLARLVERL